MYIWIKAFLPGASPLGSCGSEGEGSIFYKEIVWLEKITVGKVHGKLWVSGRFLDKTGIIPIFVKKM